MTALEWLGLVLFVAIFILAIAYHPEPGDDAGHG